MPETVVLGQIVQMLSAFAPLELAEAWDNSGLLIGRRTAAIHTVLVALDLTNEVLEQAVNIGADLVLTHHPAYLKSPKLTDDSALGNRLLTCATENIAVLSLHTNLDAAVGGLSDYLALILGLVDLCPMERSAKGHPRCLATGVEHLAPGIESYQLADHHGRLFYVIPDVDVGSSLGFPEIHPGIGRVGTLPFEMTFQELVKACREFAMSVSHAGLSACPIRVVGEASQHVQTVAICSGSGMSLVKRAAAMGADVYITGDCKYHDAQLAADLDVSIIDMGHFLSEQAYIPVLSNLVRFLCNAADFRINVAEMPTPVPAFTPQGPQWL